jgi:hypothetical protein
MASTTPVRRPWAAVLQRWPTVLAVPLAAPALSAPEAEQDVAELLPLLPLEYLIVAKVQRRQATWPVIAVAFLATLAPGALDEVPPSTVFAVVALIVLVWGAVDGQLSRPGAFRVQALGMLGFGALALPGWSWIRTLAAGWWRPAGSCMASGTWSTSSSTGWWPAPTPSSAASSTS